MRYLGRIPGSVFDPPPAATPPPIRVIRSANVVTSSPFSAASLERAQKIYGQAAPSVAVEAARHAASELVQGEAKAIAAGVAAQSHAKPLAPPPSLPGFGAHLPGASTTPLPVVAAATPEGAPIVLEQMPMEPSASPPPQVAPGLGVGVPSINEPTRSPLPMPSREAATVSVTADDWLFVAGGIALAAAAAGAVVYSLRSRRR